MISFRCRKHRQPVQRLWQVSKNGHDGLAGRPLEGVQRDGLSPGGWVEESRKLAPGLYCQHCLEAGDTAPLPDYDDQDLKDAGLLDTPHIGQSADDFDLEAAWKKLAKPLSKLVIATRDRAASPARFDTRLRTDARLHSDLRTAAGLMCSTDPDDVGVYVEDDPKGLAFRVFLADNAAGGNGLTHEVFSQAAVLIDGALRILEECPHCKKNPASRGCHCCVTTAWGSDEDVCRMGGIAILKKLKKALA